MGAGAKVQSFQLLPGMPVLRHVPAADNDLGKTVEDDARVWTLVTHVGGFDEVPGS